MDAATAISTVESKYEFSFKDKQLESLKCIMDKKDTSIVLPTGYGKTKIYAHLPEIFELVYGRPSTILVVSPLQSLMKDQVTKLNTCVQCKHSRLLRSI